jgi:hypothetical protein
MIYVTFLSFGKSMDFKYAATAKDDAKISSWNKPVVKYFEAMSIDYTITKQTEEGQSNKSRLTALTFRPSVSNFFPYCFLDLVELLVTKTNLFP